MDEVTALNAVELCEKYPNHKATGVQKKKKTPEEIEREEALKVFGIKKED